MHSEVGDAAGTHVLTALSSLVVRLGLAMYLLRKTAFCYQLFRVPSRDGRCIVSKTAGKKVFCQEEKYREANFWVLFLLSPKPLFSSASACSCCRTPHFSTAQAGGTGLNLMGAFGLQIPCCPEMIPFEFREPGIYYMKSLCSDYVLPIFHRIFKSLQISPLAR